MCKARSRSPEKLIELTLALPCWRGTGNSTYRVLNLRILVGAHEALDRDDRLVPSCPELVYILVGTRLRRVVLLRNLCILLGVRGARETAEKLLDFVLFKVRRCPNRETGRVA